MYYQESYFCFKPCQFWLWIYPSDNGRKRDPDLFGKWKKTRVKLKILCNAKERESLIWNGILQPLALFGEKNGDTSLLDLEGQDLTCGCSAYLWYDKVKVNLDLETTLLGELFWEFGINIKWNYAPKYL